MTALYRFYDKADSLLYVGVADDVVTRWSTHRRKASWWSEIARAEVTWQPSRSAALGAEKDAILTEGPAVNVLGFGPTPRQTIRMDVDLWEKLGEATAGLEGGRSEVLREFTRWYVHEKGARMPRRPPAPGTQQPEQKDS